MRRPTSPEQIAYENRSVRVIRTAQAVVQRHGLGVWVVWDEDDMAMLPGSAAHTLRFPFGRADVVVSIRPEWFRAPRHYQHAIEAAVEAAIATAKLWNGAGAAIVLPESDFTRL